MIDNLGFLRGVFYMKLFGDLDVILFRREELILKIGTLRFDLDYFFRFVLILIID